MLPHTRRSSRFAACSAALLLAMRADVSAADITKAPNGDDVGTASSWVGGIVPTSVDRVIWGSDVPAVVPIVGDPAEFYGPLLSAPATTWGGLKIVANTGNQAIDNFASGGGLNFFTLGAFGFDASQATANTTFTFDRPTVTLAAGVRQTWTVPANFGVVLVNELVRGGVNRGVNSGASVHFDIAPTGSVSLQRGMLTEQFPTNRELVIIPGATIGSGNATDFAAINADTTNKLVVPLSSLPNINVLTNQTNGTLTLTANTLANPTYSLTAPTSPSTTAATGPVLNVINQYQTTANGTVTTTPIGAFSLANSHVPQGVRFSVPSLHTSGNWTASIGGTGTVTMPHGIMVTSGVGTSNVVFTGGSATLRIGNSPWLMHLHQGNTQGGLFLNVANITATNAGASVLKTGAGQVIITSTFQVTSNATNRVAGGMAIHEGTVQVGNNGATGNLPLGTILNNASLVFNRTGTLALGNVLAGTGNFTYSGTGEVQLSGNSTYTGTTVFQAGTVTAQNAQALGVGGAFTFSGGRLALGSGVTTDLSARTLTFASGNSTLDVGANDLVFANPIGNSGAGGFIKAGTGKLVLSASNAYTGGTTISAGSLEVANTTGSATGSGAVAVGGSGTLTGGGIVSGAVTTSTGSRIAPGSGGAGTLTVGSLSLASGSQLSLELAPAGGDKIVVSNSGGLTVNGGAMSLSPVGGNGSFSTPGTYTVIEYTGAIQGAGVGALSVQNPAPGYDYTFSTGSGAVLLNVALGSVLTNWTSGAGGSWGDSGGWSNGVAQGNYTAQFNTVLAAPATVTLDGNRSVNGLVFTSPEAYTLSSGTPSNSVLTFDNGTKLAAVNVTQGNHTVSAPVSLASDLSVVVAGSSGLTLSGVVSGSKGLIKTGDGRLTLTANNTFTGAVEATGGVIAFAQPASLGAGSALTLNGAAIEYGAGNTADLSARTLTLGLNGGTIDTNNNDVVFGSAIGGNGTGRLTKAGLGSLTLSAPGTFTGGVRVTGGELSLSNIDQTGGGAIELDGGILDFSASSTIPGSQVVSIGSAGGTIAAPTGGNVTLASVIQNKSGATGALTLSGPGSFVLSTNNLHTGGTTINSGASVRFAAGLSPFGATGSITLAGGNLTTPASHVLDLNPLTVSGSNLLKVGNLGTVGSISGTGTLTLSSVSANETVTLNGSHAGLNGEIIVTGSSFTRFNGSTNVGGANVLYTVNAGSILVRRSTAGTIALGGLAGAGTLRGGQTTADTVNFQIGAKNLDTVFSGAIIDGDTQVGLDASRTVKARITKLGTGTLTLSGNNTYTSNTTVDLGTLLVDGSVSSTLAVTVNAAGTLGGAGSIAGPVSVTGTLRPNPTGLRNGTLALGSSLDLSVINAETSTVTAKTRFDFGGTALHRVVGVSVAGALTYGGALEIAIPGTTFNGNYPLFAPAVTPTGAFASISVLGAADALVATLVDNGSGVFTGTNGAITYAFTPATGSLVITGAATPAGIPAARVLSGTAGNATASLSWNSTSGATYDVFRSLTSGTGQVLVADDITSASFADSGLVNGTPYFYTVTASNDAGTSPVSNELSLTPSALSAREAWRQAYFPGSTATTGPGADTNDFDGDGRLNLLEYAVGSDPTVANTGPGYALDTVGGQLRLTFNRIDDPALTYTVTGRNDLTTGVWSAIVPVAGNNPITGFTGTVPGVLETESVNVIDPVVLGTGNPRRFLRLEVSY